ncbi:MAG: MFS transporter [Verrucomicrobiales bacterium]|nr:MFS transporter [Verrucomicrobiales bacterium]MCP5526287.1 MFS transporter [Verrucomicrobiales bacterium]
MNSASAINRRAPAATGWTLWQTLRRFPRPVWVLFLGTFVNRLGTFVVPFLALYLTREGFTAGQVSLALGAFGFGHLLSTTVGGHLADTLGRRRTIVASMFGAAGSMLLLSSAHGLVALTLLTFLAGFVGEFYRPAATALLADLTLDEDRITAYAAFRFAINAGWAVGPAVAGFVAQHSYHWLFAGDAATSALFALIALAGLPREARSSPGNWRAVWRAPQSLIAACRQALGDPPFARLLTAALFAAVVFMQIFTVLGVDMRATGLPEKAYGAVLALNGVLIVCFEIPLSTVTRRCDAQRVIALGYGLIGLGAGWFACSQSTAHYAIGMALFTFGEMISMPTTMALVSRLAPSAMRGRYMGVYGLTWGLALTAGPPVGLALFAWNYATVWAVCLVAGIAGALIMLRRAGPRGTDAPAGPRL